MPIDLVPLCTATVSLGETHNVSPTLVVGEITAVEVAGERLQATLRSPAAADWLEVSPQGYGVVDVRLTLETGDGALVHVDYNGRLSFETMTALAAPTFHTGDERYLWLNAVQAVGKGTFTAPGTLVYEMYELR
jgi:hypothetical protein